MQIAYDLVVTEAQGKAATKTYTRLLNALKVSCQLPLVDKGV